MTQSRTRGFTLIELLVVIAIIGLLSTIVVASLTTVRKKARDAKRVADVKSLELALETYFDSNRSYPDALADLSSYISAVPKDPLGSQYGYIKCSTGSGFHLGAALEDVANQALGSDSDYYNTTTCPGDFRGLSTDLPPSGAAEIACGGSSNGTAGPSGTETCYDIKR